MPAEHLFLQADGSESELREELLEAFPGARIAQTPSGLLQIEPEISLTEHLPYLVFSRQFLPFARAIQAESIRIWAGKLADLLIEILPDNQAWVLHIEPYTASATPLGSVRAPGIPPESMALLRHRRFRMKVRRSGLPTPEDTDANSFAIPSWRFSGSGGAIWRGNF